MRLPELSQCHPITLTPLDTICSICLTLSLRRNFVRPQGLQGDMVYIELISRRYRLYDHIRPQTPVLNCPNYCWAISNTS